MKCKTLRREFHICLSISTFGNNVMAHRLAGFLASLLAGATWLQTDLPHFTSPLPIMVASPRRLPVGLLPHMRHFMDKR